MKLFIRLRRMWEKNTDNTGQIAIMNPDDSINIYSSFNEAIKMLEKDPNTSKNRIEKLNQARKEFGRQAKPGVALRIDEHGGITQYKSIEELKKDIK